MSEEDDYMSDKFLTGIQDIRSSLINSRAKKRATDVKTKCDENIKKQKDSNKKASCKFDNESFQIALSKPLAEENKGFKLLTKMGYKPGQALGKSVVIEANPGNNKTGLIEPIPIVLKTDRQGLGREAAIQELNERRLKIRQQRMQKLLGGETSIEEFRRRTNQKHEEKFVLNALRRCQVTCQNLDMESNMELPELLWFWPEKVKESNIIDSTDNENDLEEGEEEDVDEFSSQEKLEMLTNYVRTSYLFCYWCGVRYNDERDLEENCPGSTKDEH